MNECAGIYKKANEFITLHDMELDDELLSRIDDLKKQLAQEIFALFRSELKKGWI